MNPQGMFPTVRLRRLRYLPAVRRLVRQVHLRTEQMILPLFVRPGRAVKKEIPSMPGHYQLSPDLAAEEVREAGRLGLGGVLLFGVPEHKDPEGREALRPDGVIPQAIRAAKDAAPNVLVITDLCFCEYTDHGHCGPLYQRTGRTDVDNDATLELLGQQAVVHAQAGADLIAPSGMMDGMVGAIRKAL
ncbi:MAG TPA: porphobilinogen synthase, partial [Thermoguttaceae bacterium]|nr:porphobilinogen synthase [Thermoguttaceae bacterium]